LLARNVIVSARKLLKAVTLASQHELEEDAHRVLVGTKLPRGDASNDVGERGGVQQPQRNQRRGEEGEDVKAAEPCPSPAVQSPAPDLPKVQQLLLTQPPQGAPRERADESR
jgi:hypothetical protein